jgi:PilZ domain
MKVFSLLNNASYHLTNGCKILVNYILLSTPLNAERRRTPRHPFGGVAEVTDAKSGKYLVAVTGEISRRGCFVKTATPFPTGESVSLRITHDGKAFAVTGMVVYALHGKGMGIVFGVIPSDDQRILEDWLAENVN